MHYYQPMWTLVGGGLKKMEQSQRPMSQVLPKVLRTLIDWLLKTLYYNGIFDNLMLTIYHKYESIECRLD